MQQYIEMTIEEALEYNKGDKTQIVLVALKNLENDESSDFVKKNKMECEKIIKEAVTIARVCDDFVNQVRVFTARQDIRNVKPHGKLNTILYNDRNV